MSVTQEMIPVQDSAFRLEDLDGESLLYHSGTNRTVFLNETATVIWKLCDGERSVGNIIEILGQNYREAGSQVEADVFDGIEKMVFEGVLSTR